MSLEIDILCDSHPNEEIGPLLHGQLQEASYAGIRTRIAHQEAAIAGRVRFLGVSEVMGHYPGSLSGDPEDVAAALNMDWLGHHAASENVLVYDVHSNPSGTKFHEVGARALRAGIVGAYRLGYETCIIRPDSFYGAVPNAVALETPIASDLVKQRETVATISHSLGALAAMDMMELEDQYEAVLPHLTFLSKNSLYITTPPGSYDDQILVVPYPEMLPSLEVIPYRPGITDLKLNQTVRRALGLPDDDRLYISGGQYNNSSPELPEQGTCNNRPRKLVLGDIYRKVEPPIVDGHWVNFKRS
jgi:hypothetical protein